MTTPTLSSRLKPAQARRLHLVMRDATLIEGHVHLGEDQPLVLYLNSRRGGWINMTRAWRPKHDQHRGHMIVQSEHIVLASSPDGNVQVTSTPGIGNVERPVEVLLVGGKALHGFVAAAPQQRLSDVFAASGMFIGLARASLLPDERPLGDVALHSGAIEILRDLRGTTPIDEAGSAPEPG